jgi:hypothetical protein
MNESARSREPRPARRTRWLLPVLIVITIVAGAQRLGAGDALKSCFGMAGSVMRGEGWLPRLDDNFIPPPAQSALVVTVWGIALATDFGTMTTVQAPLSVATVRLAFFDLRLLTLEQRSLRLRRATERREGLGDNVVRSAFNPEVIRAFVEGHARHRRPPAHGSEAQ